MTLNGANGATYDSMRTVLGLEDMTNEEINELYPHLIDQLVSLDRKVIMEIANSIWVRENFQIEPDFIEANRNYFDARVRMLDFTQPSALETINGWIAEQTHDRITDVLDYIPREAVMYLINAIYFNGTWTTEFDEDETRESTFYIDETSEMPIDMMSLSDTLAYYADDEVQMVELPYSHQNFSMLILLPREDNSVADLIRSLDDSRFATWLTGLEKEFGTVYLPRFEIGYKKLLNEMLTDLGMGIAFSSSADFTRINSHGGIRISRVIHETFLHVDEAGTEASATTVVETYKTSVGPDEFILRLDRPFLFAIRETSSNAILSLGKINRPERLKR